MKKLVILFLLVATTTFVQAQEGLKWENNMKTAIERSQNEQKPLFLFFTGSDWCGWCMKLQNEVFKTPEFVKWANEKVVLVELDFPRRTQLAAEIQKQNMELQQLFQVRGYPTVWFAKPVVKDGNTTYEQLGSSGYMPGGPTTWIENANASLAKFVPDPKPTKSSKKSKKKVKK